MRHIKLMKLILLFVLFVFLMSLFTSTFVSALQESDDNSDESTTVSSRQRRGRCLFIRDSLANGWVRMRNRGRIAKFVCNNGYSLVGSRVSTCIQGKWNKPLPVCATRGCQKTGWMLYQSYSLEEQSKGTILNVSCKTGFSLPGPLSSFRMYCDGSEWIPLGSVDGLSNRYECKSIESHFKTSEEISTISPLNSAVTAKSETTTNSKFNSKMPEMTAMSVNSVINIKEMSTESTSLSADNSETPITETIDMSSTSTNTTNIIPEVSTLTTTTTIRLNTLQTHISSTETTPKIHLTNYTTKTPQLIQNNSMQNFGSTVSSSSTPTSKISASIPPPTISVPLISTNIILNSTSVVESSTIGHQESRSDSLTSTSLPLLSTLKTSFSSIKSTQLLSTTVTKSSTEINTLKTSIPLKSTKNTNKVKVLTTDAMTSSTFPDLMIKKSTKLALNSEINSSSVPLITMLSTNAPIRISSTKQPIGTTITMRSSTLKKISQTIPEMRVTIALSPQSERNSVKISANKMTTFPNERHSMVSTTKQSLSSSKNSMKYSLFAENTTITPMRRRRQFSTKTSLVVTSSASEENNSERGLTISLVVISITILLTILSLYLIKKRKNNQQNRLSDDSEMLYLSSNEVF